MAYEVVKSETVYSGKIFDVTRDVITLPDGGTAMREIVVRGYAAAVVPIDSDGRIVFVKQYRHPARAICLEIPAGMFDDGEEPAVCAMRELEEETSMKTESVVLLTKMYPSLGLLTEIIYIYLADHLEQGEFHFDEDEFIDVERYTLDEAIAMIFSGEIIDSKTIVGILTYKEYLSQQTK